MTYYKHFKHLHVPDHWEHYWSKYPQGYTIMEALINWVSQVDLMTDNVNDWNAYLEQFVATFDTKLQDTVREMIQEMYDSGKLAELTADVIDVVQDQIDEIDDSLNAQLAQLNDLAVNVKNFKCSDGEYVQGDGVHDDSTGIQAAIDSLTKGGTVFVPAGTYVLGNTLNLKSRVAIVGQQKEATKFIVNADISGFANLNTGILQHVKLKDFSIHSSISTQPLIHLNKVNHSEFTRIRFYNSHTAMKLDGAGQCYYNRFKELIFSTCENGVIIDNLANANIFSDCVFSENLIAVDLISGEGCNFISCAFESYGANTSNAERGIRFGARGNFTSIIACRFEMSDGEALYCNNGGKYNIAIGSSIYVSSPLSGGSFRGFTGTGGVDNTILNSRSYSTLSNIKTISSVDDAQESIVMVGRNKLPNANAIEFRTYKSDLSSLKTVLAIRGANDEPELFLDYDSKFNCQGQTTFMKDTEVAYSGRGHILRSPNGTRYKITVSDTGELVVSAV